ncbi:MAG: hypothetical protein AAB387_06605 [candidate division NC10 bacterium]
MTRFYGVGAGIASVPAYPGSVRSARAFETLGDHDVAAQCREIAGRLATISF